MFHSGSLSAGLLLSYVSCTGVQSLSTSVHVCGRKSRDPYDRRFGIHLHDALPGKPGATKELYEQLSRARMNILFLLIKDSHRDEHGCRTISCAYIHYQLQVTCNLWSELGLLSVASL